MAIALTLQQYLDDQDIDYDVLTHNRTATSSEVAEASHIPGDKLAKAVVLRREGGFVVAVVPASCQVRLDAVSRLVESSVSLSSEDEIGPLFPDCDPGAIPPLAEAYGLETIIDERLSQTEDVYFEAGDHCSLIHLSGAQFRELQATATRASISEHM